MCNSNTHTDEPVQSQGLLYKKRCHSFIQGPMKTYNKNS